MNNLNQDYLSYRSDCQNCDKKPCDDLYQNRCIPNLTNKVCTNLYFSYNNIYTYIYILQPPEYLKFQFFCNETQNWYFKMQL